MSMLVPVCRTTPRPWKGFREIERHLDQVFGGFPQKVEAWAPAVDLSETEDAYTLEADLPGIGKDDIAVSVEDDVVTLKGTRKEEREENSKGYHRVERRQGEFRRAFHLPGGVDAEKVQAEYLNGVLKIHLPKPEARKPKQIAVSVK